MQNVADPALFVPSLICNVLIELKDPLTNNFQSKVRNRLQICVEVPYCFLRKTNRHLLLIKFCLREFLFNGRPIAIKNLKVIVLVRSGGEGISLPPPHWPVD